MRGRRRGPWKNCSGSGGGDSHVLAGWVCKPGCSDSHAGWICNVDITGGSCDGIDAERRCRDMTVHTYSTPHFPLLAPTFTTSIPSCPTIQLHDEFELDDVESYPILCDLQFIRSHYISAIRQLLLTLELIPLIIPGLRVSITGIILVTNGLLVWGWDMVGRGFSGFWRGSLNAKY